MTVLARPESPALSPGRETSLRRQWVQGVSLGVGVQGLGMLLGFVSGAVAARLLGPAGLGEYAYALAVAGAASVPAALGLPAAITRFLAVYQGTEEWRLARGLLRYSDRLAGLAGVLLAAGMAALGMFGWQGRRLWVFLLAAPLVPLLAGINLRQKALQGLDRPVAAQLPLQVLKPSTFLLLAGGLWLAGAGVIRIPQGIMAAWLLSVALAFLAGDALVRRSSPPPLRAATPSYARRGWLGVALPMLLADSVGVVYTATATLVLGALRPAAEVGLYEVALRTAALLAALLGASNWVLAPWFARLHAETRIERLQRVVTLSTRGVFAVTLVGFVVLVLWGRSLLGVVFGPPFRVAYPVLLVLGAARLIDVGAGPVVVLLAMTGGQRALATTVGAAALANLAGCAVLIPRLGMMGAAVSFGTAMAITNIVLAVVVRRHVGVAPTVLGRYGR